MAILKLDKPGIYKKLDPSSMLTHLQNMPILCRNAWQLAMNFTLPSDYSQVNKVVILGMGGSAIGGDLISSLALAEAKIPVLVCRDYTLPKYVDAQTLVIASSYSGMTEETLTSFDQALNAHAKGLIITTGGKLKQIAAENNIPLLIFDYKAPPRAALPFSFITLVGIIQKLGFISNKSADLEDTVSVLERLGQKIDETVPSAKNPAKQLAQNLYGKLPVIYGAGIVTEVARRFKTQLNENSKAWAFYEVFPELNHNAVVGYQFPVELAEKLAVVFLRSKMLHKRNTLRYEITQNLLRQAEVPQYVIDGEGASTLSQMMSLILFGDYVSYYLAILYDTDPLPVKVIDYLKASLSK